MLQRLYIENFAIVDNLEVEFSNGFTTVTGETGAGKSIIINAVSAIIGDRISTDIIRSGKSRAEVIADIDISHNNDAKNWLDTQQYDVDNTVIIRRIIADNGGRATLNGKPVTMGQLREFGESLVEIHGQHAHQRLMRPESYLSILDEYGQYDAAISEVEKAYQNLMTLQKRRTQLLSDTASGDINETLNFLRFQIDELHSVELDTLNHAELDERVNNLGHANDLIAGLEKITFLLNDNDSGNARTLIAEAHGAAEKLARYDESIQELLALFDQIDGLINEATSDARRRADNITLDEEEFNRLENLLTTRLELARKHRTTPEELPTTLTGLEQRLKALSSATEELENIESKLTAAQQHYTDVAATLHTKRLEAAEDFSARISAEIAELGLGKANVKISVNQDNNSQSALGSDQVLFLIATNPGDEHKPIHRVASGGELSRIALAIEVANASQIRIPTMIFDEVDVGIGGATADIVGHKIKSLAQHHQVICITHLPQVAAHGNQQLKVAKLQGDDTTRVSILPLAQSDRIGELARMLGGREITSQTRQLAQELMEKAAP